MTLSTDIIARIPEQVLIEYTNQRDQNAGSINVTSLDLAATDVQTWFETYAEEAYDSTVAIHVQVCLKGTVSLLRNHGGQIFGASADWWEAFKGECDRVKATRARARFQPSTNSTLTPTQENRTGGRKRPWADDTYFDGLNLRRRGSPGIDPDDGT